MAIPEMLTIDIDMVDLFAALIRSSSYEARYEGTPASAW